MYACISVCMCVCMHVCTYVATYVCLCALADMKEGLVHFDDITLSAKVNLACACCCSSYCQCVSACMPW